MKKFIYILISLGLFFIPFTAKVFAAEVFVSLPTSTNVGEKFEVVINANTDQVSINSINITLAYDKDLVSFSGYKNDGSMVGMWIDSPRDENGNIKMSGIIPGGAAGLYDPNKQGLRALPIIKLIFTAKVAGTANFSFAKTQILKNDGLGTELAHSDVGGKISINNTNLKIENGPTDTGKPNPFEVTFLDSSLVSKTPPMLIFQTSDTSSGIKEYKMSENHSSWVSAQSPQPISKGIFSKTITIRAYNFAGNFQEASVYVPGLLSSTQLTIIILALLMLCILGYRVLKYKHEI